MTNSGPAKGGGEYANRHNSGPTVRPVSSLSSQGLRASSLGIRLAKKLYPTPDTPRPSPARDTLLKHAER